MAQQMGLPGVSELVETVRTRPDPASTRRIVEALTTNETSWFRDGDPFTALTGTVLPQLLAARGPNERLQIWSAASSSGQEPYTIAMLLADERGATLIVAVGTHATLVEFLDKGRAGMASTFLTRLRVGGKLVDAKGVSRLYRQRVSSMSLFVLIAAALCAMAAALAISTVGRTSLQLLAEQWDNLVFQLQRLFS